jgi:hypothetical protein
MSAACSRASWFDTALTRLLTMRVGRCAAREDLILRSAIRARLEGCATQRMPTRLLVPAARCVRVFHQSTLFETEGAGKTGCRSHPWSACNKKHAAEPQVRAEQPAFPAQWFYGLYVISPVTRLCCHRHQRDAKHHRQLNASLGASGPHDFAVRVASFV